MKIIRLLFILFICDYVHADFGLDTLAIAKYPDQVARNLPAGWWYGGFAETFGDAYSSFDKINTTKKPKGFRVQLIWSDTHTFGDKDIPKIISLSKKYNQLAIKYPNIKCEISPFCEHKLNNPDKYLDIAAKHAPNCTIVNTVWTGALSKKYKNEVHGNKKAAPKGKYNFSYDGQSAWDANIEKDKTTYASSDVFFLWVPQFNGKMKLEDKTPRPERKAYPDYKQLDSTIYLVTNKKDKTSIPSKWIWKSHADQHQTPREPRASKPVLISPVKAARFELVASNGQVVGVMRYGGAFSGGGYRYYSESGFGYEIAEKAKRIQNGYAVLKLVAGGKHYGFINAAFRDGVYR